VCQNLKRIKPVMIGTNTTKRKLLPRYLQTGIIFQKKKKRKFEGKVNLRIGTEVVYSLSLLSQIFIGAKDWSRARRVTNKRKEVFQMGIPLTGVTY